MHDFVHGALGGGLIGLGSLVAMMASGKIPGVSGVFGRLFRPQPNDAGWRVAFLFGLVAGAALLMQTNEFAAAYSIPSGHNEWVYVLAGLLVGFGTRYGGGCTSGHGVCGMSMGARDSMVATVTFMVAAMATVWMFKMANQA